LQNSGECCREIAELYLVPVARIEATCGSTAVPHIASLMRATNYRVNAKART
jgi:hypothetical protein